jgi:hypothetical protein
MNYKQFEIILEKINRLYKTISLDKTSSSSIEHDLLKSYIRNLYETLLEEDSGQPIAAVKMQKIKEKIVEVEPRQQEVVQSAREELRQVDETANVTRSKVEENARRAAQILENQGHLNQTYAPPKEVIPPPPVVQNTPPPAPEAPIHTNSGRDEITDLFKHKEAKELSERLGAAPITDLSRALGVNEKIFTINELFGGNKELYDRTVNLINGMSNFEEAKDYLIQNIARTYDWANNTNRKKAKVFIKLVRRRFA